MNEAVAAAPRHAGPRCSPAEAGWRDDPGSGREDRGRCLAGGAATRANSSTLFLDELGEMAMPLQTKLLRFIQTGTYQPVGDSRTYTADIRFIAATNRNPAEAIRQGQLREDLFYRLHVVGIGMPTLRERGEDILLIARHFLGLFANADGKRLKGFTPDAEARQLTHPWPGNVRQLQNFVRNIVVLHDGPAVTPEMMPTLDPAAPAPLAASPEPSGPEPATATGELLPLAAVERRYIEHAIARCSGNIQLAARRLQISPSTIYRKMEGWAKSAS